MNVGKTKKKLKHYDMLNLLKMESNKRRKIMRYISTKHKLTKSC